MSDKDDTLTNILSGNLVNTKQKEGVSDFYDYNPLKSSYKCYTCQKHKQKSPKRSTQLIHAKSKAKKRKLDYSKLNDVVIKPWHPFLREFQKIFKNNQQSQNYPVVYNMYEIIRRLREQLKENINLLQIHDQSITKTIDVLASYSIEEVECNFDDPKNRSSLKYLIQDKRITEYKEQNQILNESIKLLEQREIPNFKTQIERIIQLQKEMILLRTQLIECQELRQISEADYESLKEENYYLYTLVRQDRQELFKNIMKQYPPELLKETQISYFELYLTQLERELAQVRLQKSRLQQSQDIIEKDYEDKDNQFSSELKVYEEKWSFEKTRIEGTLEQVKSELTNTQRAENELRIICRNQNQELEKLRQQLFECQNGMNNVSHQNLLMRQQNDQFQQQNQDLQRTISQLEQKVVPKSLNSNAKELALIILNKEKASEEQLKQLQEIFGEYADKIIQNPIQDQNNNNNNNNDQRQLKERFDKQLQFQMHKLDQIRREIEVYLESQSLTINNQQTDADLVIKNIHAIIIDNDRISVSPINFKNKENQNYMLLMQAIVIEEMINQQEQRENFSEQETSKDIEINRIDEQENEDGTEQDIEEEQSSFLHPQPYQNDEVSGRKLSF